MSAKRPLTSLALPGTGGSLPSRSKLPFFQLSPPAPWSHVSGSPSNVSKPKTGGEGEEPPQCFDRQSAASLSVVPSKTPNSSQRPRQSRANEASSNRNSIGLLEIILASAARLRSWRNSGKVPRPARGMISPFWVFFFIQEVEIFFLVGG